MWFGGLPGDAAGNPVRRKDEAILEYGGPDGQHAAVLMSKRIDLDRVLRLLLLNEEFLRPRILPRGCTRDPWAHTNAYETHFEHKAVRKSDGSFTTFTFGITDHEVRHRSEKFEQCSNIS